MSQAPKVLSKHFNVQRNPSKNKGYFQSFTGLVKAPPFSESWVCADKWEHLLSLEHFSAASSSMDAFFHCHTVCVHFGAVAKDTLRNRNSFFFTPIRTIKWHCYFKPVLRSTLEKQCCWISRIGFGFFLVMFLLVHIANDLNDLSDLGGLNLVLSSGLLLF